MNKRNFLKDLLALGAGFTILPGAARSWKKTEALWIPNPAYESALYEVRFWVGTEAYNQIQIGPPPIPLNPCGITPMVFKREKWNGLPDDIKSEYLVDYYPVRIDSNGTVVTPTKQI